MIARRDISVVLAGSVLTVGMTLVTEPAGAGAAPRAAPGRIALSQTSAPPDTAVTVTGHVDDAGGAAADACRVTLKDGPSAGAGLDAAGGRCVVSDDPPNRIDADVHVPADLLPGTYTVEVSGAYLPSPVIIKLRAAEWSVRTALVVQTRVPDIVGVPLDFAERDLTLAGLAGQVTTGGVAASEQWQVAVQDPPGGSWADPGTTVRLEVAPLLVPATPGTGTAGTPPTRSRAASPARITTGSPVQPPPARTPQSTADPTAVPSPAPPAVTAPLTPTSGRRTGVPAWAALAVTAGVLLGGLVLGARPRRRGPAWLHRHVAFRADGGTAPDLAVRTPADGQRSIAVRLDGHRDGGRQDIRESQR